MSSAWEGCAKASGIDAAVIKACSEGQEGKAAIEGEFRKAMSLKIYRSPTFMINNKKLFSAVSAKEIQTGICETNTGFKGCRMNLTSQSGGLEGGSCA
jgi:predicted DsbA family dithiol-disulfide isomerase